MVKGQREREAASVGDGVALQETESIGDSILSICLHT
jgi:hypothetical protein